MKKELREYLLTIGLRSSMTDKEAWNFYRGLSGEQRERAREIRGTRQASGGGGNGDGDPPAEPAPEPVPAGGQRSAPQAPAQTPAQAIAQERDRVSQIRSIFGDDQNDHRDLMQRAIDDGWDESRTANELLSAIRDGRTNPVGGGAGPGIHTRGGGSDTATLQAAMLLRSGVSLDNPVFTNSDGARAMGLPAWMRADVNNQERQQVMDEAHRLGPQSLVDMCRHSLVANGQEVPVNRDEMIRAAFSTGSLEPVYTTNVNARLLASYMEAEDTTAGWTSSIDFDDFKQNELTTMGKMGRLTRHGRGKTADLMDRGAETEPMRIYRYSGQYQLDEIDIINNRLGNPESDSPEEMGRSAKQTEMDLAYAVLLANNNLVKDNIALFDGPTCNNDFIGAQSLLEVIALEKAIMDMMDQRQRGRPLNLSPAYLLVPPRLKFHAQRILNSATLLNLVNNTTNLQGSANVLSNEQIQVVCDSRLGTQGVVDPYSETQIDGNDKQWFLTAAPGVGGAKTIAKGFRTGTGRMPTVRSFVMDRGTWGIGWDINHDVGAKAIDRLGMQRHASDQ